MLIFSPSNVALFFLAFVTASVLTHRIGLSRQVPFSSSVTSDDIRRLTMNLNLIQLQNELLDLHANIMLTQNTVSDTSVKAIRNKIIKALAEDVEDVNFKFRDVFRVMEQHLENT